MDHPWVTKAAPGYLPGATCSEKEQASTVRPLTSRIKKSMLPALTSDFPEFFRQENRAQKGRLTRLFCRDTFLLKWRRDFPRFAPHASFGFLRNFPCFPVTRFQLRDVGTLLEMRGDRFTRQHAHLRE
jgi:hypothetical protein